MAPTCYVPAESAQPLQRIVLTTDGTVGGILEQYAGEAIEVAKLRQAMVTTTADIADLEVGSQGVVLSREVLLRDRQTRRTFSTRSP
jgi:chorismate-pyruvate lyase